VKGSVELIGHVEDSEELKHCVPATAMVMDVLALEETALVDEVG
jgi:hypothetical protein